MITNQPLLLMLVEDETYLENLEDMYESSY